MGNGFIFTVIFFFFWVRATLPRIRVDRLMDFAWKYLVPLALLNILISAVWFEVVIRPSAPNGFLGWLITAPLVVGSIVGIFAINRAALRVESVAGQVP